MFIAGGIGITPFMSMLRHMRAVKTNRKVLLLYANKTSMDIIFQEELKQMVEEKIFNLKVIHVLTQLANLHLKKHQIKKRVIYLPLIIR